MTFSIVWQNCKENPLKFGTEIVYTTAVDRDDSETKTCFFTKIFDTSNR